MLARASWAIKLCYPNVFFKKGKGGPFLASQNPHIERVDCCQFQEENYLVQTVKSCCSTHSIVPLKSENYFLNLLRGFCLFFEETIKRVWRHKKGTWDPIAIITHATGPFVCGIIETSWVPKSLWFYKRELRHCMAQLLLPSTIQEMTPKYFSQTL